MCIILKSVMVVGSQLTLVTPYQQETLIQVADEMTILSYSSGLFLIRGGVVNIKLLQHFEISRVI
jgi:hypothetical protein